MSAPIQPAARVAEPITREELLALLDAHLAREKKAMARRFRRALKAPTGHDLRLLAEDLRNLESSRSAVEHAGPLLELVIKAFLEGPALGTLAAVETLDYAATWGYRQHLLRGLAK